MACSWWLYFHTNREKNEALRNGKGVGEQVFEILHVMHGLGLAMPIAHGRGHHFLGAAFSHATSACVSSPSEDGDTVVWNNGSEVLVFAWGEGGGSKTAKAAQKAKAKES